MALQKLTDCVLYTEGQRKEFTDNKFYKKNIALQLKSKKNVRLNYNCGARLHIIFLMNLLFFFVINRMKLFLAIPNV